MKLKLLLLGLIIGGFLYNGSGFAQTESSQDKDQRPLIERVHRVKHNKAKYKVKLKAKKAKKAKKDKKKKRAKIAKKKS